MKGAAAEKCWNRDEVFTPDHQCEDVESVVAKPPEVDKGIAMVAEEVKSSEIENAAEPAEVKEVLESPKGQPTFALTLPESVHLKNRNTIATAAEVKDTLPGIVISEQFFSQLKSMFELTGCQLLSF